MLSLSPLLQPLQRRHDLFSDRFARMPLRPHRLDRVRFGQPEDRVTLVFIRRGLGAAVAGNFLLTHCIPVFPTIFKAKAKVGFLRSPNDARFLFFWGLVIQNHNAWVPPPCGQGFGDVSRRDMFAYSALIPPVAMAHVVETVWQLR